MFLILFLLCHCFLIFFFLQLSFQKISIILFFSHSFLIISILDLEKLLASIVIVFNHILNFICFLLEIVSELRTMNMWIIHGMERIVKLWETWWFLKSILLRCLILLRIVSYSSHTHWVQWVCHFVIDSLIFILGFFVVMFLHSFLQFVFEDISIRIFIIGSRVFIDLKFLEQLRFDLLPKNLAMMFALLEIYLADKLLSWHVSHFLRFIGNIII